VAKLMQKMVRNHHFIFGDKKKNKKKFSDPHFFLQMNSDEIDEIDSFL